MTVTAFDRARLGGILAALVLACGGGGGDDGIVPRMLCSGAAAPAPDRVTLGCPAEGIDTISIAVHLGGPTTSSDIYGLEFDLVFDPTVAQFQPPAMEGSFLNRDGATTIVAAGAMEGDPGRLVVAIARQGEPAGLGAVGPDQVVITLLFRGNAAGTTTLAFENAAVVDSALQPIATIEFGAPLTLTFD